MKTLIIYRKSLFGRERVASFNISLRSYMLDAFISYETLEFFNPRVGYSVFVDRKLYDFRNSDFARILNEYREYLWSQKPFVGVNVYQEADVILRTYGYQPLP